MEIKFDKYEVRGSDYHYRMINKWNPEFNLPMLTRYTTLAEIIKDTDVKILDVGCGDGVQLYTILKDGVGAEVCGVDLSSEAIEIAKKKMPTGSFECASAYELPHEDNEFDYVVSTDVIEHVMHPEKMLEEMKRVTKSEGIVIIGTPIRITENPLDPLHVQEFFQNEFKAKCEKYFKVEELYEFNDIMWMKIFAQKLLKLKVRYILQVFYVCFGFNPFKRKKKTYAQQQFTYMYLKMRKV